MTSPERERLEARAKALNVTVRSLKACKHPESLVYFDKVYGMQSSWQVCDYCEQEFNFQTLEGDQVAIMPQEYMRTR
jgi:hypothetical protein